MKLIILDRDGVINRDSPDYVKTPDEWIPIAGSIDAIAQLTKAGYQVVVATNQSGLGRGLFDQMALQDMHRKMCNLVTQAGGHIVDIFFCPHKPDDECECRKPKPGLLIDIAKQFNMALDDVPFIGDSMRDIEAARLMGCQPYLVKTGKGLATLAEQHDLTDVFIFNDLKGVVDSLVLIRES